MFTEPPDGGGVPGVVTMDTSRRLPICASKIPPAATAIKEETGGRETAKQCRDEEGRPLKCRSDLEVSGSAVGVHPGAACCQ
jgi:hypothetical protein